jgi:O-antigen ligase
LPKAAQYLQTALLLLPGGLLLPALVPPNGRAAMVGRILVIIVKAVPVGVPQPHQPQMVLRGRQIKILVYLYLPAAAAAAVIPLAALRQTFKKALVA